MHSTQRKERSEHAYQRASHWQVLFSIPAWTCYLSDISDETTTMSWPVFHSITEKLYMNWQEMISILQPFNLKWTKSAPGIWFITCIIDFFKSWDLIHYTRFFNTWDLIHRIYYWSFQHLGPDNWLYVLLYISAMMKLLLVSVRFMINWDFHQAQPYRKLHKCVYSLYINTGQKEEIRASNQYENCLSEYGDSHVKDKKVTRLSYL